MTEIKVVKVRAIELPAEKSYLSFTYKCPVCETENEGGVVDTVYLYSKSKKVLPMETRERCSNCKAKLKVTIA